MYNKFIIGINNMIMNLLFLHTTQLYDPNMLNIMHIIAIIVRF